MRSSAGICQGIQRFQRRLTGRPEVRFPTSLFIALHKGTAVMLNRLLERRSRLIRVGREIIATPPARRTRWISSRLRSCHGMRAHHVTGFHRRPRIVPGHHQVRFVGERLWIKRTPGTFYQLIAHRRACFRGDVGDVQKGRFVGVRVLQLVHHASGGIPPVRPSGGQECVAQNTIPGCLRPVDGIDEKIERPRDAKAVENRGSVAKLSL